jgi:hypothetical protein
MVDVIMSDGSSFVGSLGFGIPYNNDNGLFSLIGNQILVAGNLSGLCNTVQYISILATSP